MKRLSVGTNSFKPVKIYSTYDRKFADEHGIYYPSSLKVLIITSKQNPGHSETSFPYQLRINWDLFVDIHHPGILDRVLRLVAKVNKHEGWSFQINGKYQPDAAMDALENAQATSNKGYKDIGLYPAMQNWKRAPKDPGIYYLWQHAL